VRYLVDFVFSICASYEKNYSLCGVITCIWSYRTLSNPRVNFPDSAGYCTWIFTEYRFNGATDAQNHKRLFGALVWLPASSIIGSNSCKCCTSSTAASSRSWTSPARRWLQQPTELFHASVAELQPAVCLERQRSSFSEHIGGAVMLSQKPNAPHRSFAC